MIDKRTSFILTTLSATASRSVHAILNKKQRIDVGKHQILLPPRHKLPAYQRLVPTYDRYAGRELMRLCEGMSRPMLIDIGANVGDTAVLALDSVPLLHVLAVEGDARFLRFLHRNTADLEDRVTVLPAFLLVGESPLTYRGDHTSGHFVAATTASDEGVAIEVGALWPYVADADFVIWKSDTDGLDVELVRRNWTAIDAKCDVVWFELDPKLDIKGGEGIAELAEKLARSQRHCTVFDNYGRRMVEVAGAPVVDVLVGLSDWLQSPGRLPNETAYLDVWAVRNRSLPGKS